MIALQLSREVVAGYLAGLDAGTPVTAYGRNEYLMLAGACWFAALSQGPVAHRDGRLAGMPAEHREAVDEEHERDIEAAAEFCMVTAMKVMDGEYQLPPVVTLLISVRDGQKRVAIAGPGIVGPG